MPIYPTSSEADPVGNHERCVGNLQMCSAAGPDIDVVAVVNPFPTAPAAAGEKYSQVIV
ncbi:hypothetical protein [Mycobacterium sp.]|uniref:hypothetical protein n=1 Tax=Mycobacterium sp. TaxID=1785 RepID=UPI003F9AF99C